MNPDDFSLFTPPGDPWDTQSIEPSFYDISNFSGIDPLGTKLCDRSSGSSSYAEDHLSDLCLEDLSSQANGHSADDILFSSRSTPGVVAGVNDAVKQGQSWNCNDSRSSIITGVSTGQFPYESLLKQGTDTSVNTHLLPICRVVPAYHCTKKGCSASFVGRRQLE